MSSLYIQVALSKRAEFPFHLIMKVNHADITGLEFHWLAAYTLFLLFVPGKKQLRKFFDKPYGNKSIQTIDIANINC
jgi:hypothetical protein